MLDELDRRYPSLGFECLLAEDADVLALVQGRAELGLLAAQSPYPGDIEAATLPDQVTLGLYAGHGHPLADAQRIGLDDLAHYRALRLKSVAGAPAPCPLPAAGRYWSAPDYLLLLEMAARGFGWAELPHWLVKGFGQGRLVELAVPGWPQALALAVDVVWSRRRPLGPAGTGCASAYWHQLDCTPRAFL